MVMLFISKLTHEIAVCRSDAKAIEGVKISLETAEALNKHFFDHAKKLYEEHTHDEILGRAYALANPPPEYKPIDKDRTMLCGLWTTFDDSIPFMEFELIEA